MLKNPYFLNFKGLKVLVDLLQELSSKELVRIESVDKLESALDRVKNRYCHAEGEELKRFTPYYIAAFTMEAIAKCHGLVNGNKRLALLAGVTTVMINGQGLNIRKCKLFYTCWERLDALCFEKYGTFAFEYMYSNGLYTADIIQHIFKLMVISTGLRKIKLNKTKKSWRERYYSRLRR